MITIKRISSLVVAEKEVIEAHVESYSVLRLLYFY